MEISSLDYNYGSYIIQENDLQQDGVGIDSLLKEINDVKFQYYTHSKEETMFEKIGNHDLLITDSHLLNTNSFVESQTYQPKLKYSDEPLKEFHSVIISVKSYNSIYQRDLLRENFNVSKTQPPQPPSSPNSFLILLEKPVRLRGTDKFLDSDIMNWNIK
ncbi:hypothetical protein ACTA71_010612 [Dictyostelium dimigraforme]